MHAPSADMTDMDLIVVVKFYVIFIYQLTSAIYSRVVNQDSRPYIVTIMRFSVLYDLRYR